MGKAKLSGVLFLVIKLGILLHIPKHVTGPKQPVVSIFTNKLIVLNVIFFQ